MGLSNVYFKNCPPPTRWFWRIQSLKPTGLDAFLFPPSGSCLIYILVTFLNTRIWEQCIWNALHCSLGSVYCYTAVWIELFTTLSFFLMYLTSEIFGFVLVNTKSSLVFHLSFIVPSVSYWLQIIPVLYDLLMSVADKHCYQQYMFSTVENKISSHLSKFWEMFVTRTTHQYSVINI